MLGTGDTLSELESGQLLHDFNIHMNPAVHVNNEEALLDAAESLIYPLVLKTAEAGIFHKTDQKGVVLNLENESQLKNAYADISQRLGSNVLLSPMVKSHGVEMVLGMIQDEQFGPVVLLGFGGVNVEVLKDVTYALPPFNQATARRMVDKLAHRPLLNALRDRPALNIDAFCAMAERFSLLAASLGTVIKEIDINPIMLGPDGCTAVDALVIGNHLPEPV